MSYKPDKAIDDHVKRLMMEERSPEKDDRPARDDDYFSRLGSSSRLTPRVRRMPTEAAGARLASIQATGSPTAPRTPRMPLLGRSLSSNFNSPGLGFRTDDEFFVFEFGSRYLRAGLGGERQPRCQLDFGPETQRRAGDYIVWLSGKQHERPRLEKLETWGKAHEMWRMDLRGVDLDLIGDKIERALRTAIVEHLLVLDDSRKRKFVLSVPPAMPHPLLSILLTALFNLFPPPPTVSLLSSSLLCTVAAGLRSALVVDIGWADTTVSAVYEYREVQHRRSTRAMKLLSWEVRNMLMAELAKIKNSKYESPIVSFNDTEEVLTRMVWCQKPSDSQEESQPQQNDKPITIPLQSTNLSIPFSRFTDPVETTLFAPEIPPSSHDDHELPLPLLLYTTLLHLPIDIRNALLPRILFTGGGSHIPGLKPRLLSELHHLISTRGWDPVHNYGSATNPPTAGRRTTLRPTAAIPVPQPADETTTAPVNKDIDPDSQTPTHLQPPLPDPVVDSIRARDRAAASVSASALSPGDATPPPSSGTETTTLPPPPTISSPTTLGAWAGASLLAGLRIRGLQEIDGERFMKEGLASAMAAAGAGEEKRVVSGQMGRQSLAGGGGGLGWA